MVAKKKKTKTIMLLLERLIGAILMGTSPLAILLIWLPFHISRGTVIGEWFIIKIYRYPMLMAFGDTDLYDMHREIDDSTHNDKINAKVCRIIKTQSGGFFLQVDNQLITFHGESSAEYFVHHYHRLGYKVSRIKSDAL